MKELNFKILDKGYLRYVNHMGSDEEVVEAARMSTGKGFLGWYWEQDTYADVICWDCRTQHLFEDLPEIDNEPETSDWFGTKLCTNCWSTDIAPMIAGDYTGVRVPDQAMEDEMLHMKRKLLGKKGQPKDLSLLETLMANRHATPFEMGELVIEVKAPIMVFREWHRHRTQSYNEMSGRYVQMPNDHYVPPLSRIQKQSTTNKQGSEGQFNEEQAGIIRRKIGYDQQTIYETYNDFLDKGVAKEIARINTPVARYSRMRAKANLRNWLGFLSLRMDLAAQWEIQQYAMAVGYIVKQIWPKTFELWMEHEFMGQRFSRAEMRVLRKFVELHGGMDALEDAAMLESMFLPGNKATKNLLAKLTDNREEKYTNTLYFLENGKVKEKTS